MSRSLFGLRALTLTASLLAGSAAAPWPMPMLMTREGDSQLMWMGQAFIVDTAIGPRAKLPQRFSFSGPSLVDLTATHADRRCTRFSTGAAPRV